MSTRLRIRELRGKDAKDLEVANHKGHAGGTPWARRISSNESGARVKKFLRLSKA